MIIVGSGPAGLTAALYAARANLNPLVLAGPNLGGQAALTYHIENYPGFPEGIGGAELGRLFQQQAERFGATVVFATATQVHLATWPFRVTTDEATYQARTLIIATGASPRTLQVPGEREFIGRGVSYCATCDGWFFKDRDVVVVGGGDSALEEGIFLTRYARRVTIVHRRDTLRAGAILQERARHHDKIRFLLNTVVTAIVGEETVQAVRLRDVRTGAEQEMPTSGVFVFIGHDPNTALVRGQLALDERGYIVVDARLRTSIPRVFAAGEVADPVFRQVITSAGMGASAAMEAERWLAARLAGESSPRPTITALP
jgi:thioredoxin reductase (NADPH)